MLIITDNGIELSPPAPQDLCKQLNKLCTTVFDVVLNEMEPPPPRVTAPKKPDRFLWEMIDDPWDLVEALD
jgi:hypothetical protein